MNGKIPAACVDVKCMMYNCPNQAAHKVVEANIWHPDDEMRQREEFDMQHGLSTYLCDTHYQLLMSRDVYYGDLSKFVPREEPPTKFEKVKKDLIEGFEKKITELENHKSESWKLTQFAYISALNFIKLVFKSNE